MAVLGEVFQNCPEGYKRYSSNTTTSEPLITFNELTNLRSWGRFGTSSTSSIKFYVKNVKEIRFINLTEASCGVSDIYINDELIDTKYYSNFSTCTDDPKPTNAYWTLCCQLELTSKYNKIEIKNNSTKQMNFSAIDIPDDGGELISEEIYNKYSKHTFILKVGTQYKTYNIDTNTLDLIDDISTLDKELLTEVSADYIPNALALLESTNDVKLIFGSYKNVNVTCIKNKNEMLVMRTDISNSQISKINSIFSNCETSGNGALKFIVSVNSGLSWMTYKNDTWEPLSVVIPQSKYSSLNSDEKIQWDNATNAIATDGINYSDLSSIDFNTLEGNTLRFAVVLSIESKEDIAIIKNIMYNVRKNDYLMECSYEEVDRIVSDNTVKIVSNITTPKLVVNVEIVGLSNDSFDYNLAENKPVLGNITLEGVHTLEEAGIASKYSVDLLTDIVDGLSSDRYNYRGFYANEADRDTSIENPQDYDFCVVGSSTNDDAQYNGKTIKYIYISGEWKIYAIIPIGGATIDDDGTPSANTVWSSDKTSTEIDKKQDSISIFNINIDASQFVEEKSEESEYNGFYKVTVTHNLKCLSDFILRVYTAVDKPYNMGVTFDNISENSFDLYSLTKQTLKIKIIAI